MDIGNLTIFFGVDSFGFGWKSEFIDYNLQFDKYNDEVIASFFGHNGKSEQFREIGTPAEISEYVIAYFRDKIY